jgi:hypothetical protein
MNDVFTGILLGNTGTSKIKLLENFNILYLHYESLRGLVHEDLQTYFPWSIVFLGITFKIARSVPWSIIFQCM